MRPTMDIDSPGWIGALALAVCWALAEVAGGAEPSGASLPRGLVAEAPARGPVVETAQGFMVPYVERIPGTDAQLEMIPVPGGRLPVFSERQRGRAGGELPLPAPSDKPTHFVSIAPFWIGKYEVTWGQFQPYADLYPVLQQFDLLRFRPRDDLSTADAVSIPTQLDVPEFYFQGLSPQLPVAGVTQFSARQYTKWLSLVTGQQYRLPAEAEWEYACRAGTTTQFSWGEDMFRAADFAVVFSGGRQRPTEVGSRRPNLWGLCDMHGNMAEWVLDGYSPQGIPPSDSGALDDMVRWPEDIHPRVVKGGSWENDAHSCRVTARMGSRASWSTSDRETPTNPWWHSDGPVQSIGFRVVRSLAPLSPDLQDRVWNPDCDALTDAVKTRRQDGRGAVGRIDEKLPDIIRRFKTLQPSVPMSR